MNRLYRALFPTRYRASMAAGQLYAAILSKARAPELFGPGGFPDTLEGRFNAVTLFSGPVFPALEQAGPEGAKVSQRLYKRIFSDVDAALRETGVGDASIARKVRRMGEAFFGVAGAANAALNEPDPVAALARVLTRNAMVGDAASERIAREVVSAASSVRQTPPAELVKGTLTW